MNDPERTDLPQQPQRRHTDVPPRAERPPFDTSDLNDIPGTTDDDPPYRSWWVIDTPSR